MGQAGMLDTARFVHFVSEVTGVDVLDIQALTLGSHGPTMVPVPSLVKVGGKPLADVLSQDQIDAIVDRTRKGGSEIVALLKTGSAYFAPSAAAAQMVKAVINDTGEVMPVCAWTTGEYGVSDVYLGVPAKLGAKGVEEIVELPLTESEMEAVKEASVAVKAKIDDLHSIVL